MHLELIVLVLHFCELTFIRLGLEIGFMHTINQTRAWAEINPEETITGANASKNNNNKKALVSL